MMSDKTYDRYADDAEEVVERVRKCPVCGGVSFPRYYGEFETCPTCKWVDDWFQAYNPDEGDLSNIMSLNEARVAYKKGKQVK